METISSGSPPVPLVRPDASPPAADFPECYRADAARMLSDPLARELFLNAPDPLLLIDERLRILACNEATERTLDTREADIVGRTPLDFSPSHQADGSLSAERAASLIPQLLSAEQTSFDWTHRRQNGDTFEVRVTSRPLPDRRFMVSWHDVSQERADQREQAWRAAQLAEAHRAAEAANQAREKLLATMSHELRTPLNSIMGALQLIMLHADNSAYVRESSESALRRAEQLLTLVNSTLDASLIEDGQPFLLSEPFVLPLLLQEVMDLCRNQQRPQVSLHCTSEALPTLAVLGDAPRLKRVLVSLLGNALQCTTAGEVTLHARVVERRPGGPLCEFSVIDTGIDLADAAPDELSPVPPSADAPAPQATPGSAIPGLALYQRLVLLMGGEISVLSDPGRSTTFRVRLPLGWTSPEEQAIVHATAPGPATPEQAQLWNTRVLIVDDDRHSLIIAAEMLKSQGAEVSCAVDGGEALLLVLEKEKPDVILMDVQMPVMSGLDTTRRLRTAGYRGPIVALTANAEPGDRVACLAVGMSDYLSKPLYLDKLIATRHRVVGSRSD